MSDKVLRSDETKINFLATCKTLRLEENTVDHSECTIRYRETWRRHPQVWPWAIFQSVGKISFVRVTVMNNFRVLLQHKIPKNIHRRVWLWCKKTFKMSTWFEHFYKALYCGFRLLFCKTNKKRLGNNGGHFDLYFPVNNFKSESSDWTQLSCTVFFHKTVII